MDFTKRVLLSLAEADFARKIEVIPYVSSLTSKYCPIGLAHQNEPESQPATSQVMTSAVPRQLDNVGFEPYLEIIAAHESVQALAYLPDGDRLVTASGSGLEIWNLEHRRKEGKLMLHNEARRLLITQDRAQVISAGWDESIRVWDAKSQKLVSSWIHLGRGLGPPSLALSPDDQLVAVGGLVVGIYTLNGEQASIPIQVGLPIWSMAFSSECDKLACSSYDDIRVYGVKTGTLVFGPLKCHLRWVNCVLWSRDDSRLFASYDKIVRCWNSETGQQIGQPWTGHSEVINTLCLSPDGSIMASASNDRTIRFWDTTSGDPVGQCLTHPEFVDTISFSPRGEFIASAGRSPNIYVWWVPWLSRAESKTKSPDSSFGAQFPQPPDLTSSLSKIEDQYIAGGSFGDIYRCWYASESMKTEVAVKAFRFKLTMDESVDKKDAKMLRRELGIWKRLDHVNIVPFLGIAHGFGMLGSISLVSLWMHNGSLHIFLATHDTTLGLAHRLQFLLGVASGLNYLHSLQVVHGDLNCNNVLVDTNYNACLVDFGYASFVGSTPEALNYLQRSTTRPGALRWAAPEQLDPETEFVRTPKSDVYAFGCIALQEGLHGRAQHNCRLTPPQVLSGKVPWSELREDMAIALRLAKGHNPGRPTLPPIDDLHWKLIRDCWSSVGTRPAIEITIPIIRRFLRRCPELPSLRELLTSSSNHS